MVAYVTARASAKTALAYYDHLRGDDARGRTGEAPGRWIGGCAERLSLNGPVTETEFAAALEGVDPKTGERLAQRGPGGKHVAGWDMIFSADKSVSVLWALSEEPERQAIEEAHRSAVMIAAAHLERSWARTRRGRDGVVREEEAAGLLMARFDHHTSRASDPLLHSHCFIFNVAPRWDGSWGTIVSRQLYRAQKDAGAVYRRELAGELERLGYRLDREAYGFRVAAIPRDIALAFSKRNQAIEKAARDAGWRTAKSMKLTAVRTLGKKPEAKPDRLFATWKAEAKALGFELGPQRWHERPLAAAAGEAHFGGTAGRFDAGARSAPQAAASHLGQALRSLDQPSGMSGAKVRLRQSDREQERE